MPTGQPGLRYQSLAVGGNLRAFAGIGYQASHDWDLAAGADGDWESFLGSLGSQTQEKSTLEGSRHLPCFSPGRVNGLRA